jgi:hypothetical protein
MQVFFLILNWLVPWPVFTPVTSENSVKPKFAEFTFHALR